MTIAQTRASHRQRMTARTIMLKRGFKAMLAEANAVIETVSIQDLPYHLEDPDVVLVDVRETVEREREGMIPASVHVPRGLLEFQADPDSPVHVSEMRPERRIILYCGTGGRSALAAKTLMDMGYADVASLAGGYEAWRAAKGK
jgi:rhodanese-related sulfurtransferase